MSENTTEATTLIEVKTIGGAEHIVHASGQWDGTDPVEMSNDGVEWTESWTPTPENPVPQFARVTVYRKGVTHPTRKTIRWDEQFPEASEEWAAKWLRSPMRHFGRTVRMVAMRETFRDLLGNMVIEDEGDDRATAPRPADITIVPLEKPRDWLAEFANAGTIDELDAIVAEGRRARIFVANNVGTALDRAWKDRRRTLTALATAAPEPSTPAPEQPADVTDGWPTAPLTRRPEPRDFQTPKSSATKRRRTKKRGRR